MLTRMFLSGITWGLGAAQLPWAIATETWWVLVPTTGFTVMSYILLPYKLLPYKAN